MEGLSNKKTALPVVPVLERISLTSGTVGSSTPLMNCKDAASHATFWRRGCTSCKRGRLQGLAAVKGRDAPAEKHE